MQQREREREDRDQRTFVFGFCVGIVGDGDASCNPRTVLLCVLQIKGIKC